MQDENDRFFRQGLTFLLNSYDVVIRYFHHSEKYLICRMAILGCSHWKEQMQITRLLASLAFIVAVVISPIASGQIIGRPGQIAGQPLGGSPYTSTPQHAAFDPGNLDYDMQAFAPLDISEFDEDIPVAGGFFASWDRTYLSVRRPRPWGGGPFTPLTAYPRGSDFQSGNLFSVGNMSDDGAGWDINYLRSSGLFFNEATGPALPRMTVTSMHFVELNRAFRQPLTRGGFIEPYFGIRYRYFQDRSNQSTNTTFGSVAAPVTGLLTNVQTARNSIIGGGVGFRIHQQRGRWKWTFDTGLDGGFNTQTYMINEQYASPGATIGNFALNRSRSAFTPNADVSTQLTYRLTRDVSLKLGGQMSFMWGGITRADTRGNFQNRSTSLGGVLGASGAPIPTAVPVMAITPPPAVAASNQGAMVAGFTFGLEWRR